MMPSHHDVTITESQKMPIISVSTQMMASAAEKKTPKQEPLLLSHGIDNRVDSLVHQYDDDSMMPIHNYHHQQQEPELGEILQEEPSIVSQYQGASSSLSSVETESIPVISGRNDGDMMQSHANHQQVYQESNNLTILPRISPQQKHGNASTPQYAQLYYILASNHHGKRHSVENIGFYCRDCVLRATQIPLNCHKCAPHLDAVAESEILQHHEPAGPLNHVLHRGDSSTFSHHLSPVSKPEAVHFPPSNDSNHHSTHKQTTSIHIQTDTSFHSHLEEDEARLRRQNRSLLQEVESLNEDISSLRSQNTVLKQDAQHLHHRYESQFQEESRTRKSLQLKNNQIIQQMDSLRKQLMDSQQEHMTKQEQINEYESLLEKYKPQELKRREMKRMELEQQKREKAVKETETELQQLEHTYSIWKKRQEFYQELLSSRGTCGKFHPKLGDQLAVLSIHVEGAAKLWQDYSIELIQTSLRLVDETIVKLMLKERFIGSCKELPREDASDGYCLLFDHCQTAVEFTASLEEALTKIDYPSDLNQQPLTKLITSEQDPFFILFNGPRLCMGIEYTTYYPEQEQEFHFIAEAIQEKAYGGDLLISQNVYKEIEHISTFSPKIMIQEHETSQLFRVLPTSLKERFRVMPTRIRTEREHRPHTSDYLLELEEEIERKREQLKIRQSLVLQLYKDLESKVDAQTHRIEALQYMLSCLNEEIEDKTTLLREKVQFEEEFWKQHSSLTSIDILPSTEEENNILSELDSVSEHMEHMGYIEEHSPVMELLPQNAGADKIPKDIPAPRSASPPRAKRKTRKKSPTKHTGISFLLRGARQLRALSPKKKRPKQAAKKGQSSEEDDLKTAQEELLEASPPSKTLTQRESNIQQQEARVRASLTAAQKISHQMRHRWKSMERQFETKVREMDSLHLKLQVLYNQASEILLVQNPESLRSFLEKYSEITAEKMQQKNQILSTQLKVSRQEIEKLTQSSSSTKEELYKEKMHLEKKVNELQLALEQMREESSSLHAQLETEKETVSDLQYSLQDYDGKITSLKQQLEHNTFHEGSHSRVGWQPYSSAERFLISNNCHQARHMLDFVYSTVLGNTCWTSGQVSFTVNLDRVTDCVFVGIAPYEYNCDFRPGATDDSWSISINSGKLFHGGRFCVYSKCGSEEEVASCVKQSVTVHLDLDEGNVSFELDGTVGEKIPLHLGRIAAMTPAVAVYHFEDTVSIV